MKIRLFRCFLTLILITATFDAVNAAPVDSGGHVFPEVPRITAFEAKHLFDQGKLVLANAHEKDASKKNMLLGAIAIPADDLESFGDALPDGVIVAFYCG